jgi:hypothetical protein
VIGWLSDAFWIAGIIGPVKDVSGISQEKRRKFTARGFRKVRERLFERIFGQTARVAAFGECLQGRGLVVDDDRLFISGPSVVEILHDNRPIDRCFGFFLIRVMLLLIQPQMAKAFRRIYSARAFCPSRSSLAI